MKAKETIVIICLMGTISQAVKLLKVPRIYNALITSDKELLPSQAFPALSPVLQSIHFPYFTNALYQPINVPAMSQNPGSSISIPKSFERPENQIPYETYAKDTRGIPLKKDNFSTNPLFPKFPVLFIPNPIPKNNNKENTSNIRPSSNFKTNTDGTNKPFYPHSDEEIGQIFNVVNYNNKKLRSAFSPTSSDSYSEINHKNSSDEVPSVLFPQLNTQDNSVAVSQPNNQFLNEEIQQSFDSSPQLNLDQYQFFDDFVKNNAVKDKNIVDVPPPPLPVSNLSQKRKETGAVNPMQLAIGI